MNKQLQELMEKRDHVAFSMIEANGDEYYELQRELDEIEQEIYVTKQLEEVENEEAKI